MGCRWVEGKSVVVGDHAVVVGEVVEGGRYGGAGGDRYGYGHRSKGVVYIEGVYREVGHIMELGSRQ